MRSPMPPIHNPKQAPHLGKAAAGVARVPVLALVVPVLALAVDDEKLFLRFIQS